VGRRHLPQVQLRPRLRPPHRNLTITNCYVTGCYELGTVLDGTFKKFPPKIACHAPAASSAAPNPTAASSTSPSPTASSRAARASRSKPSKTARSARRHRHHQHHHARPRLRPLFLRLGARLRGPKESTNVGTLRRYSSVLSGIPNFNIEDVKLSNIYIQAAGGAPAEAPSLQLPELEDHYPEPTMFGMTPSSGFYLRHVKNLEMSHLEIATTTPDPRPAFHLDQVERADFFAITAPKPSGTGAAEGAFALHSVKDLRISWSRAAADTTQASVDNKTL
jgi:hypothetical protein